MIQNNNNNRVNGIVWYFKTLFVSSRGPSTSARSRQNNVNEKWNVEAENICFVVQWTPHAMEGSQSSTHHTFIRYFLHFPFAFRRIRCRSPGPCGVSLTKLCVRVCVRALIRHNLFLFACNQTILLFLLCLASQEAAWVYSCNSRVLSY